MYCANCCKALTRQRDDGPCPNAADGRSWVRAVWATAKKVRTGGGGLTKPLPCVRLQQVRNGKPKPKSEGPHAHLYLHHVPRQRDGHQP